MTHMSLAHILSRMLILCEVYRTKLSSTSQRVKASPASCLSASTILSGEQGRLFTRGSTGQHFTGHGAGQL